jgi:hypothetical protein
VPIEGKRAPDAVRGDAEPEALGQSGKVEKWKSGKVEKWKSGKLEKWKSRAVRPSFFLRVEARRRKRSGCVDLVPDFLFREHRG